MYPKPPTLVTGKLPPVEGVGRMLVGTAEALVKRGEVLTCWPTVAAYCEESPKE